MSTTILPVLCPSCLAPLEPGASACAVCGTDCPAAAKPTTLVPAIPSFVRRTLNRMPVRVQLAISIDRTGSSMPFTDGISSLCQMIFDQLRPRVAELRVSVFSHGDLQDCQQEFLQLSSDVSAEQAMTDIRSIKYGGGGSTDEDHLHAVDELLKRGSFGVGRNDRGFLVLLTTDGSHPHPQGKTPEQIAREILARNLVMLLVGTPGPDDARPACPRLRSLVDAAKGSFFIPISNEPGQAELQQVASKVAASITRSVNQGTATLPMRPER